MNFIYILLGIFAIFGIIVFIAYRVDKRGERTDNTGHKRESLGNMYGKVDKRRR